MGALEGGKARAPPPHTLPACCSPVGRLGPIVLDVGFQGNGESLLQLVHHAALDHTWAVWREGESRVVPVRPWGQRQARSSPERANCQATTLQSQRCPSREIRGALRGLCITPQSQGEISPSPHPGCAVSGGQSHQLRPSLGRAEEGLLPPAAKSKGSEEAWEGARPSRIRGALTWGEEGDGLHQHIFLLMQLQLLQHVVKFQHRLQ